MNRTVALRAAVVFVVFTLFAGALGLSAYAPAAEILFVISASLAAVMLAFGFAVLRHSPTPVRVRSHRPVGSPR